ncbi:MAG TPA: hypothetical protein VFC99_22335 [Acidimicrobiia bacterium]|nr:hypothetical protein [Acidimicrobiia bacterium]
MAVDAVARPDETQDRLLHAMTNLTRYHREHEKFYGSAPRETAVMLQRHARTLQALADRWSRWTPSPSTPFSPFEGCTDLNDGTAIQLDGVLFMEGEGTPAEIGHLVGDLRSTAADGAAVGQWLAAAMEGSWGVAASLLDIDELASQLGERHRIIANDWEAADLNRLTGRILERAADMLDRVDFTPAALRADLAAKGRSIDRCYSAAELIDHAADLACQSSALVHQNERRWRIFRARVEQLLAARGEAGSADVDEAAETQ